MRILTRLAAVAATSGCAALALAADPAGHGSADHGAATKGPILGLEAGVAPGIMTVIVFVITLFILGTVVWPKIAKGLDDRAEKIRSEIAAAEMARKQARDALDEYERSLAEARIESQRMIEQTRADQARLAAELKAQAERELGDLRFRATQEIESAKRAAVAEIHELSVRLATVMAARILGREVSSGDQQRLIEESLGQLQASRN